MWSRGGRGLGGWRLQSSFAGEWRGAQRKEPLGEGRPQSWRAGIKGTRDKGTGKGRLLSTPRKELSTEPSISSTLFQARQARAQVLGDGGFRCPRHPSCLSCMLVFPMPHSGLSRPPPQPTCSKSVRLPLIGCPSSALICHPVERQRIIYSEKRKTLKVSANDRHDTLHTGAGRQEQGGGSSSLRGLSPAAHTPGPIMYPLRCAPKSHLLGLSEFFP